MDANQKQKWVTALRSGKYTQHHGTICPYRASIRTSKHLCCIGVGAAVTAFRGKAITQLAADHLGLSIPEKNHLVNMNDGGRASFDQIADYIEEKL